MKMTVEIDRKLLAAAKKATGMRFHHQIIRKGLKLIIQDEAMQSLIAMGGTQPHLKPFVRKRYFRASA